MKTNEIQEEYPMPFRDKIDEYLYREHGILAGCCSSIESLKYTVAREVAEKLNDALINKACNFIETYPHLFMGVLRSEVIKDFKNYIKGE